MNNKILKAYQMLIYLAVILPGVASSLTAQNLPLSAYGLPYINSDTLYRESLDNHPEKLMVPLSGIPGLILDLRYASVNNFMHKNCTRKKRRPVF